VSLSLLKNENAMLILSAAVARSLMNAYIPAICGRVIQSSGPLRYAIVDGMNLRDSVCTIIRRGGMPRRVKNC
jgi:hypothetical protein